MARNQVSRVRARALVALVSFAGVSTATSHVAEASQREQQRIPGSFSRVAIDGRWMVTSDIGAGTAGTAWIHRRDLATGRFELFQELTPSVPTRGFGNAIAIDGDVVVVGAPHWRKGAPQPSAWVFEFDGTTWVEKQRLVAGAPADYFGDAVAVHGDQIVVGAPMNAGLRGAAWVFRRTATGWAQVQKLVSFGPVVESAFGYTVATHGDHALVGAPGRYTSTSGHAYLFRFDAATGKMAQVDVLEPSAPVTSGFGNTVALDEGVAVVGANRFSAVQVFEPRSSGWIETQVLRPLVPGSWFGNWVDVEDGLLAIGEPYASRVVLFRHDGRSWIPSRSLASSTGGSGDFLGEEVCISGRTIAATALDAISVFDADAFDLFATSSLGAGGATHTFETSGGGAGAPVLLAIVAVSGIPVFTPIASGAFDSIVSLPGGSVEPGGEWLHSILVPPHLPPGVAGQTVTLQSFGIAEDGRVAGTGAVTVRL